MKEAFVQKKHEDDAHDPRQDLSQAEEPKDEPDGFVSLASKYKEMKEQAEKEEKEKQIRQKEAEKKKKEEAEAKKKKEEADKKMKE